MHSCHLPQHYTHSLHARLPTLVLVAGPGGLLNVEGPPPWPHTRPGKQYCTPCTLDNPPSPYSRQRPYLLPPVPLPPSAPAVRPPMLHHPTPPAATYDINHGAPVCNFETGVCSSGSTLDSRGNGLNMNPPEVRSSNTICTQTCSYFLGPSGPGRQKLGPGELACPLSYPTSPLMATHWARPGCWRGFIWNSF